MLIPVIQSNSLTRSINSFYHGYPSSNTQHLLAYPHCTNAYNLNILNTLNASSTKLQLPVLKALLITKNQKAFYKLKEFFCFLFSTTEYTEIKPELIEEKTKKKPLKS